MYEVQLFPQADLSQYSRLHCTDLRQAPHPSAEHTASPAAPEGRQAEAELHEWNSDFSVSGSRFPLWALRAAGAASSCSAGSASGGHAEYRRGNQYPPSAGQAIPQAAGR